MLIWVQGKLAEIESLIKVAVGVMAMVYIGSVWWKTKALVPTLTALVLAGGVFWGVSNIAWLRDMVGRETNGVPVAPRIVVDR
ncbi:MAG: hypothetical protein ACRD0F_00390 [Acidimicrobiales bacterium]